MSSKGLSEDKGRSVNASENEAKGTVAGTALRSSSSFKTVSSTAANLVEGLLLPKVSSESRVGS